MIIKKESKGEIYDIIIDDEDYEKFCEHNWYINHDKKSNTKYCRTNIYINGKQIGLKLHRFLMGLEKGDKRVINHKDFNGLNNLKSNLEICDQKYNSQSINTKRRFGHICYRENRVKKHQATVSINKKRYCKSFLTYGEAEAWLDGLKQIAIAETIPLS